MGHEKETDKLSKEYRENWCRLIQKIHEMGPLSCPRYSGRMKMISVRDDEEIIGRILKHAGLWKIGPPEVWQVKARPPPRATGPSKIQEYKGDLTWGPFPWL